MAGYVPVGTHYRSVVPAGLGAAVFEYGNDQPPATLWYHDHTLGITRLNVYAGMAGFYLIRDAAEGALGLPGPAPEPGEPLFTDPDDPPPYFEIPLAIQDRSFADVSVAQDGSATDGALYYPPSRAVFDDYAGPYVPATDVPPIWNPEFFGNSIVVNGRTWPYLNVAPRKYRFRVLKGCNARFLVLELRRGGPDGPALAFHQVGTDGGLLEEPVALSRLLLGPAERADIVVDLTGLPQGTEIFVRNFGPDEPFEGPEVAQDPSDPGTTGQVMKLVVASGPVADASVLPRRLTNIRSIPPRSVREVRDLTLNEKMSMTADIPIAALLGTAAHGPVTWSGVTEVTHRGVGIVTKPRLGTSEIWQLVNLTENAHPIHLHLVQFQILDRQRFLVEAYAAAQEAHLLDPYANPVPRIEDFLVGEPLPPAANEDGWKETVVANPAEVTRIIARFDLPGLYVWHCHILEDEDNEMMLPYEVVKGAPPAVCGP